MKVYITQVERGFIKNKYSELTIVDEWESEFLPIKDDIIQVQGSHYKVLQRNLYYPTSIKLYVEKCAN